MKGRDVLFSSSKRSPEADEWATPDEFYGWADELALNLYGRGFDLDVAATKENTKCVEFFTKEDDALKQDWSGRICWCNPPYSNIASFAKHFSDNSYKGAMLVPSRTDTKWFHSYIWYDCQPREGVRIHFIKGRLKFGGSKNSAPFPSMLVFFN